MNVLIGEQTFAIVHVIDRFIFLSSFLYTLMLSMDANFRLKLKDRGFKDNSRLGDGLAYFVDEARYNAIVLNDKHVTEVCNLSKYL